MDNTNPTPLKRLRFEKGLTLKQLFKELKKKKLIIGYPTLVNLDRGFKMENIQKRLRGKYGAQIEKGNNGRLYFPNRPINEPKDFWAEKIKKETRVQIEVIDIVPIEDKMANVFFRIMTDSKRLKYDPSEDNLKKLAKYFKTTPDKVYEDRSNSK